MKVLLTGAFGNVGQSTIEELVRQGREVRCFDIRTPANEKAAAGYAGRVEVCWGDIRRREDVELAMDGCQAVIHLAFIIPSRSSSTGRSCDEDPAWAEGINVGGTRSVIEAAKNMKAPPRVVFASSVSLYGFTHDREPPVRAEAPVFVSDLYTDHKMKCEQLVTGSGLEWIILRFSAVPTLDIRLSLDARMAAELFDMPLGNRIEFTHTRDVGTACANAVACEGAVGRRLIVAGGPRCQMTYRQFIKQTMATMGIGEMPESAFTTQPRYTDWYDTTASQELLNFQNHTYDDYLDEIRKRLGVARHLARLFRPLARWYILRQSPYYRQSRRP